MDNGQKITWIWQDDILREMNDYDEHKCNNPSYEMVDLQIIDTKKMQFGLAERLNPTIQTYKIILTCEECYDTFEVICEYGHNSKTDHFEVIEIKKAF